jgi:RHS repeat-associated protein
MGFSLTTLLARPSARPPASPKTHTPLPRLQERGHRFYSPEVGKWVNRDPIGEMGGENAYLAFYNDPVGQIDPDGRCPVFVTPTDQGGEREVQSIRDIAVELVRGSPGGFKERIDWVISNPAATIEEALADTSPVLVCDFKFVLRITVPSDDPIRSGQEYFYVPHVRGNDGLAVGNGPFDATKMHEMGHAYAYWVHVRPCAERIHARWGSRALSDQEQRQVQDEYEACQTDPYWLVSGRYANEWERNYYDVTASGQFRRTFPSDPSRIGRVTQRVNYGGFRYNATDIWVAQ